MAEILPGFFSLTVPTGGGKTLASMAWALLHAVRYKKKRIIIVIPYTSIIVQTAAVLRDIFGAENVVEHHSNLQQDSNDERSPSLLATENWDAPIIVTTNVQFFESLPTSIIEAGRIDGCTQLQTFFYIVLPLSKPICSVIAIFAINAAWSDFLLPYLVLRGSALQTVMVRLFVFSTEQTVNADTMMRSVVFSMIPPIILFFIFQKQLTENAVSVGIKG